jgi:hypothetical protein
MQRGLRPYGCARFVTAAALVLPLVSCGGGGGGGGDGGGTTPPPPPPEVTVTKQTGTASNGAAFTARILNIDVEDLQWDAPHAALYASVTAQSDVRPRSIIALDPAAATITKSVSLANEASVLRMSENAQFLYASLPDAGTVVRYTLPDLQSDVTLTLGVSPTNGTPLYAQDMDVHPTQPRTLAVAIADRFTNPHMRGPVVFDDATMRAPVTTRWETSAIEWNAGGTGLSGYTNDGLGLQMFTFDVDNAGVYIRDGWGRGVTVPSRTMALVGDRYYLTSGEVLRASDLLRAGMYVTPYDCLFAEPEPGDALIFALCGSEAHPATELIVHAFNVQTLQPVATATINRLQTFTAEYLTSIVRHGTNGLAFMTPGKQLVLLEGDFLTSTTAEQRSAPEIQTITTTGVSQSGAAFTLREVNVDAYDVIFDRVRKRLYFSMPGHAQYGANSITVLDPQTGVFEASHVIGSEPDALALTDGGDYLYVGTDGSSAVRRIRLDTWRIDATLDLGRTQVGPLFAREIAVAPSAVKTVAIGRSLPLDPYYGLSTPARGIVVFDDATQRPRAGGTGDVDEPNGPLSSEMQWGADAGTIYGANTQDSSRQYSRYTVPADGPLFDAECISITAKRFAYLNGRFYESGGVVRDATTCAELQSSPLDFSDSELIEIDEPNNSAYFVKKVRPGSTTPRYEIYIVTLDTMTLRDVLDLRPGPREDHLLPPIQLVRWGDDGLALLIGYDHPDVLHDRSGAAHLLLVNSPAIRP